MLTEKRDQTGPLFFYHRATSIYLQNIVVIRFFLVLSVIAI